MKRWLVKLALFLILGAIVNVAVAWGFALCAQHDSRPTAKCTTKSSAGLDGQGPPNYVASQWSTLGTQRITVSFFVVLHGNFTRASASFEEVVPPWALEFMDIAEVVGRTPRDIEESRTHTTLIDAHGWPCLALWGGMKLPHSGMAIYDSDGWAVPLLERHYWIIGLRSQSQPGKYSDIRSLPLRPIWPGFAINTLLYATILWLPFGALAVRRRRRIRRGLCPKCAYDLRGSPHDAAACPECGATK